MFSATFPEGIQKLAADFLNDYLFLTVGRFGGANTDVKQEVHQISKCEKRNKLCEVVRTDSEYRFDAFTKYGTIHWDSGMSQVVVSLG